MLTKKVQLDPLGVVYKIWKQSDKQTNEKLIEGPTP